MWNPVRSVPPAFASGMSPATAERTTASVLFTATVAHPNPERRTTERSNIKKDRPPDREIRDWHSRLWWCQKEERATRSRWPRQSSGSAGAELQGLLLSGQRAKPHWLVSRTRSSRCSAKSTPEKPIGPTQCNNSKQAPSICLRVMSPSRRCYARRSPNSAPGPGLEAGKNRSRNPPRIFPPRRTDAQHDGRQQDDNKTQGKAKEAPGLRNRTILHWRAGFSAVLETRRNEAAPRLKWSSRLWDLPRWRFVTR